MTARPPAPLPPPHPPPHVFTSLELLYQNIIYFFTNHTLYVNLELKSTVQIRLICFPFCCRRSWNAPYKLKLFGNLARKFTHWPMQWNAVKHLPLLVTGQISLRVAASQIGTRLYTHYMWYRGKMGFYHYVARTSVSLITKSSFFHM